MHKYSGSINKRFRAVLHVSSAQTL